MSTLTEMAPEIEVEAGETTPAASPVAAIVSAVGGATSAAIGGLAFASSFRAEDVTQPVVAAAVTGAAASFVVTGLLRRRLGIATAAVVPLLIGAALAFCGDGASLSTILSGLVDGPRQVLTSAVPVQPDVEALVVPFALTGAGAFLGSELAQRSRAALAPLLPGLMVLVAGLLFGINDRLPPSWIPTAWVAVALLIAGWRAGKQHDGSGRVGGLRGLVAVGLLVVPVIAVARWAEPKVPGSEERDRRSLRELFDPPADPATMESPLVALTALQTGPDDVAFVAETSAPVARWRQVVLDAYDGSSWRSQGDLLPVGAELPRPADGELQGARVRQTIEPVSLRGRWLPVADRVVDVSAGDVLFDEAGGVLIAAQGLPERYEVTSIVPVPNNAVLVNAAAADDEEAELTRRLPDIANDELLQDIVEQAEAIVKGSSSDYAKATAIERFLSDPAADAPYELVLEDPPSGHTLGHLRCFLFAGDTCGHRGSTEQFVAAFALLARSVDLPTRIVVGFEGSAAVGRDDVTAHEATAWAEVKFAGVGWVAFDPVPDPTLTVTPPTTALPGEVGDAPDEKPEGSTGDDEKDENDNAADKAASSDSGAPTVLLVAAAVILVLGAALAAPGVLRALRRRRRRQAPDTAARLAGAWATAVDELRRGGTSLAPSLPVRDIVAAAHETYPAAAAPLSPLGRLVNRARFARSAPTAPEADEAWALTTTFVSDRRKGRPLARRLREYFSPS